MSENNNKLNEEKFETQSENFADDGFSVSPSEKEFKKQKSNDFKREKEIDKREKVKESREERLKSLYEKREERKRLRAERIRVRREENERRREEKRRGRKDSRNIVTGLICSTCVLAVLSLSLGSALAYENKKAKASERFISSAYEKSYYNFVECIESADVNLSKLTVSSTPSEQQKLLMEIITQTEIAEDNLSALPTGEWAENTISFINKVGDYCKYLNNKISSGEQMTAEEKEIVDKMSELNSLIRDEFNSLTTSMRGGFDFKKLQNSGKNAFAEKFQELNNSTVELPTLIYDGPFSDGLINREIKGLKGDNIEKSEAEENAKKYFSDYKVKSVKYSGMTASGIECYNFDMRLEDGTSVYAQISKKGGKLIMFTRYSPCDSIEYTIEECAEMAEKSVEKFGFKDMKAVWATSIDNTAIINLAYNIDGVIVYSDLVKVKVCMDNGSITALESSKYYTNHVERSLGSVKIDKDSAMDLVSDKIMVESGRLTLIPKGNDSEVLAYEFSGEYNGSTYYIYIDAVTGDEVEIFKVIETTEGTLLM